MPRYEWGPSQDQHAELADVALALRGVRKGGLVDVSLGEGDPELSVKPTAVHVLYLAEKPGPDVTPEAALTSCTLKGSLAGDDLKAGDNTVTVAGPIPPGIYYVATVLEFAD